MICAKEPDRIVLARNESPLVVGVGGEGVYCASDVTALLSKTHTFIELKNGEMAILEKRASASLGGSMMDPTVERPPFSVDWSPEMAEKGGYDHFMLKEIYEQPKSLRQVLRLQRPYVDIMATLMDRAREVYMVAAGTSHHTCLAGFIHVHQHGEKGYGAINRERVRLTVWRLHRRRLLRARNKPIRGDHGCSSLR